MISIISIILSVLSFTLSVLQWIFVLRKQSFNISVSCTGYSVSTSELISNYRDYTFGFIVNNHSSLPISINSVCVRTESGKYKMFDLTKRFLKEHFIPPGTERTYQLFSSEFPVNIDAYSSSLVYATYETKLTDEHIFFDDDLFCHFEFVTNRKTVFKVLRCERISLLEQ